jgi:hypothetical protein
VQAKLRTFYAGDSVQNLVVVLIFRFFFDASAICFFRSAAADSVIFISTNFLANTAQEGILKSQSHVHGHMLSDYNFIPPKVKRHALSKKEFRL